MNGFELTEVGAICPFVHYSSREVPQVAILMELHPIALRFLNGHSCVINDYLTQSSFAGNNPTLPSYHPGRIEFSFWIKD